jgi:CDP-4-dehydro-6-deoxyglucose reductase
VFVACDTGFGPIKSLIEHAIAQDEFERIDLYWLATRAGGHYLENQCRAWAASLDQFHFVALADADPAAGARKVVAQLLADHRSTVAAGLYLAGPAQFVATAREALTSADFPAQHIRLFCT